MTPSRASTAIRGNIGMLSERQQQMVALFEKHVGAELAGDLDTTMATMSDDPQPQPRPDHGRGVAGRSVPSIAIISSASSFRRM